MDELCGIDELCVINEPCGVGELKACRSRSRW